MRYNLLVCLLMILPLTAAQAQVIIQGKVVDTQAKPLSSATISLKDSNDKIIAYTRSDQQGNFTLNSKTSSGAHLLEVSSLGYTRQKISLVNGQSTYNFRLQESTIDLPTVVVNKRPHLKLHGDTLSYQLSDFSDKNDRVLEDVLKKMPGIEVAANGKITYNGKAISNFYIDGDNLLDDKYNIATRTIRKEAIDKLQVIENDQPVKMLRNKTVSDDVALNITIKDEAKLKVMGQAGLGAGLPGKFDENANAMMFNKKYKGINYLKGNNIGKDAAEDLVSHNLDDYLKRLENDKPDLLLSGGTAGNPGLSKNRYLFNQAALININNLFNYKNDVQLKTNLYYLRDRQERNYSKYTEYYLPSGNISYNEIQHNISHPDQLHAQANLTVNRDKFYVSNAFLADYNPVNYQVGLNSNGIPLMQHLNQQKLDLSNEFNLMNTLKSGKVVNYYSYLNVIHQPEDLMVNPGLNPDQFNNGIVYTGLQQNLSTASFFTSNYVSLKNYTHKISQTYKAGFTLQEQHLSSTLLATQADLSVDTAIANGVNNLHWNRAAINTEAKYEYPGENLKATLTLPLNYQHTQYEDPGFALDKDLDKMIFNPKASIKLQTSVENYLMLNLSHNNKFGTINDIYAGAILRSYRNLFANDAPLTEQQNNTAALAFNYKKSITLFFFSVQATYSKMNMNTISSSLINNDLQQKLVLPFDNHTDSYSLSANASKYWFAIKSTVSGTVSYNQSSANQIQNEELLTYKSDNIGYNFGTKSKVTSWMNLDYTASFNQYSNKNTTQASTAIRYDKFNQQCAVGFTVLNVIYINTSGDYSYTKQTGQNSLVYLFADLSVRYRVEKLHADFEFAMTNFTNIKTYKDVYLSTNMFTRSTYQLPGRITMLRATFNF